MRFTVRQRKGVRRTTRGLILALLGTWRVPDAAQASAWNEPAGQGLVIMDYTFSGGSKYFNGAGKLSPAAAYRKQEAIGYVEYGVTDGLTALVKPSLAMISAAASPEAGAAVSHYAGLGTSEAGAQLHVMTFGPAVFALQGTVRLPGTTSRGNPAMIGDTSREAELRGLVGGSFSLGGFATFVDVEAGYRFRSGGAPAEWHADFTLGARVLPRLLLLVQSFNVVDGGSGTAWYPAASSSKLGGAAVFDLTDRWSIEAGAFETVHGTGALRERGAQLAVWYRF